MPHLTRGSLTSTSIELKWLLSANGVAPITKFHLRYASANEVMVRSRRDLSAISAWREFELPPHTRTFMLTRLSCKTRYHVQLVADNEAGSSDPAELSEFTIGMPSYALHFLFLSIFEHKHN